MTEEYKICKYDATQEDKYGWAVCECMPNCTYGIRIKRKKENHYFNFNCPKCGKELGIVLKGTNPTCNFIRIL